jgi:hypothetical protein
MRVKKVSWWAAGMLAAVLVAGCAPISTLPDSDGAMSTPAAVEAAGAEIPVVTIRLTETGLEAPAEMPSGVVAVVIEGGDPENAPMLARLNEGVTMEQLGEALVQPDPMAALPLVSLLGGAASVDGQVIYDLRPGDYAVVHFPGDGPPSAAPIVAGEPSGAAPPTPDIAVSLVDFSFAMPDKVATGPQIWQIENAGEQWHEMPILKLNEGVTVEELMAVMADVGPSGPEVPLPFEIVAFWSPMGAGEKAWVTWDLPPGEYTVICFLPDLAGDMSPHVAHGMIRTLVVE